MSSSPRHSSEPPRYRESNTDPDSDESATENAEHSSTSSSIYDEANRVLLNPEGLDPTEQQLPGIAMVQHNNVPGSSAHSNTPESSATPMITINPVSTNQPPVASTVPVVVTTSNPVITRTTGTTTDLPMKGTREAPKTFKGRYSEVEDFLDHYEKLLSKHNVASDRDKCDGILSYCSSSVKGVIRSTDEHQAADWAGLKKYLLKLYDAEKARQRYLPHDVFRFSQRSALRSVNNLSDWLVYCRRYQERAGGLHKAKKISETDYRMHFWHGIPPPLRIQLEDRLWRANPKHDITQYFPISQFSAQAEQMFHRNKFTTLHAQTPLYDQDSEDDSSTEEELSSTSDSDDSSLSSAGQRRRTKKKKRAKGKKRRDRKRHDRDDDRGARMENVRLETREHVTKPQGTADEVQDIIRQLGALRVDDSAYAALYYRALQLDSSGAVEKCVRPYAGMAGNAPVPAVGVTVPYPPPIPVALPSSNNYPPTGYPPPRRSSPPFANNRPPQQFGPRNNGNPRSPEARMEPANECFGCGVHGHKLHECGVIQQKLQLKEIAREPSTNRYIMADGEWIRRNGNESLAAAVDRILDNRRPTMAGKSLLVTLKDNVQSYLTHQASGDDEEDELAEEEYGSDDLVSEGNEWEEVYWDGRHSGNSDPEPDDPAERADSMDVEVSDDEDPSDSSTRTMYLGKSSRSFAVEREIGKGREARNKAVESPRNAERPRRNIRPPVRADGTRAPTVEKRSAGPSSRDKGKAPEQPLVKGSGTPSEVREASQSKPSAPREQVLTPIRIEEGSSKVNEPKKILTRPPLLPARVPETIMEDIEMREVGHERLRPVDARGVRFQEPLVNKPSVVKEKGRSVVPVESRRRTQPSRPIPYENTYQRRVSEISNRVSKEHVLQRILDAPVTMPIRDILGSSGDLSRALLEMIKLKNPNPNPSSNPNPQVMTVSQQTNRDVLEQLLRAWMGQSRHMAGNGQLIRIPLINNGCSFEGILDTGSELNVLNSRLSDLGITAAPIDITQGTRMSDANGGEGRLTGVIEDIGMQLGPLRLSGDFFVGDQVPFDVLLGRPWQTKNRVSIDERSKGTYLVFKDSSYRTTHEMLVVPTLPRPDVLNRVSPKTLYMAQLPSVRHPAGSDNRSPLSEELPSEVLEKDEEQNKAQNKLDEQDDEIEVLKTYEGPQGSGTNEKGDTSCIQGTESSGIESSENCKSGKEVEMVEADNTNNFVKILEIRRILNALAGLLLGLATLMSLGSRPGQRISEPLVEYRNEYKKKGKQRDDRISQPSVYPTNHSTRVSCSNQNLTVSALRYLFEGRFIVPRAPSTFPCLGGYSHQDYCMKKGYQVTLQDYNKPLAKSKGHPLLDEPQPENPTIQKGFDFSNIRSAEGGTKEDLSALVRHMYPGVVAAAFSPPQLPAVDGDTPWIKMQVAPLTDSFSDELRTHRFSASFGGFYFHAPGAFRPWAARGTSQDSSALAASHQDPEETILSSQTPVPAQPTAQSAIIEEPYRR